MQLQRSPSQAALYFLGVFLFPMRCIPFVDILPSLEWQPGILRHCIWCSWALHLLPPASHTVCTALPALDKKQGCGRQVCTRVFGDEMGLKMLFTVMSHGVEE